MAKTKSKKAEDNITLTISQAAQAFPTSKAHAFQIEKAGEDNYYFRIADPIFLNNSQTRSVIKCVKFNRSSGFLVQTNLSIKVEDKIIDMTIKAFNDMVISKMNELLKDAEANVEILVPYEVMGFMAKPALKIV